MPKAVEPAPVAAVPVVAPVAAAAPQTVVMAGLSEMDRNALEDALTRLQSIKARLSSFREAGKAI